MSLFLERPRGGTASGRDLVFQMSFGLCFKFKDKFQVNPSVLIGSFLVAILPYGPFMQTVFILVYLFVFESVAKVTYNKLLPNLACSSRTEEYWPLVVLYGPRYAGPYCPDFGLIFPFTALALG